MSGPGAKITGVDSPAAAARPVWLIDVDGVLAVDHPHPTWPGGTASALVSAGGRRYRLTWAPALLDRVRSLGGSGLVEPRWATTWGPWRHLLEDLWEVPAWPLATDVDQDSSPGTVDRAKLAAALAVAEAGRPLVWADDWAIPRFGPARRRLDQAKALLISPDPRHGLTPGQMGRIEQFCGHQS